jgi:hypothetical protein
MNIFDTAKSEIKEMLDLAGYIQAFDNALMYNGLQSTKTSADKRNRAERRYVELLKKYT